MDSLSNDVLMWQCSVPGEGVWSWGEGQSELNGRDCGVVVLLREP